MKKEVIMGIRNPRRNHKDRLFVDLFSDKANALSLFNAVNGTGYTDVETLEIVTLGDALYLTMNNDLAICFHSYLSLMEHQSSANPNTPIRGLMYYGKEIDGWLAKNEKDIYGKNLVKIPAPEYYVLYNGIEEIPDRMEYHLSDAFKVPVEGYEWTAHVLNINAGHSGELMERCPALRGYAEFVARIRKGQSEGLDIGDAIASAMDSCIEEGFLKEYLLKNRGEVMDMVLTEYNEALHERTLKEEGRAEGRAEGEVKGFVEACQVFGKSFSETARNLVARFVVSEPESERLVKMYWKAEA